MRLKERFLFASKGCLSSPPVWTQQLAGGRCFSRRLGHLPGAGSLFGAILHKCRQQTCRQRCGEVAERLKAAVCSTVVGAKTSTGGSNPPLSAMSTKIPRFY